MVCCFIVRYSIVTQTVARVESSVVCLSSIRSQLVRENEACTFQADEAQSVYNNDAVRSFCEARRRLGISVDFR